MITLSTLGILLAALAACSSSEPAPRRVKAEPVAAIDARPIDAPPVVEVPSAPDAPPQSVEDILGQLQSDDGTGHGPLMDQRGSSAGASPRARDTPGSERKPRISIASKQKLDTRSTLDVDTMLAAVRDQGLAGIKRCYLAHAKQHPDDRASLTLQLVVDPRGHATEVDASGVSATVETCTEAEMRRWRFPQPKTATGAATEARFRIELKLLFE
ncbi:MAG: AgmX/PglI C-terminal domain-containing protein [Kofleriaceae bacterium]